MAEQEKIIAVGDQGAHIAIDWGSAGLTLSTFGDEGVAEPVIFGLDTLDELLDALHEVRREISKAERISRIVRLPVTLRDALEAKARREGISQNAALIEAIERYVVK